MSAVEVGRDVSAGGWNASDYAHNARFVAALAEGVVDWLDPVAGERILDLGCGDGALTQTLVARGAQVVGCDRSRDLLAAAAARGLDVVLADGQALDAVHGLEGAFDAVFSNAALHWMHRDPQAVIDGVFARLTPGGRFVAELGAAGNCAPIRAALRTEAEARGQDPEVLDPWYFPEPAAYIERLRDAGFRIERYVAFERPTPLPGDMDAWLHTLARPFVHAFAEGTARDDYVASVCARLVDALRDARGAWTAPYVRLRLIARRPA